MKKVTCKDKSYSIFVATSIYERGSYVECWDDATRNLVLRIRVNGDGTFDLVSENSENEDHLIEETLAYARAQFGA